MYKSDDSGRIPVTFPPLFFCMFRFLRVTCCFWTVSQSCGTSAGHTMTGARPLSTAGHEISLQAASNDFPNVEKYLWLSKSN